MSCDCDLKRLVLCLGVNTAVIPTVFQPNVVNNEGGVKLILFLPQFSHSTAVFAQIDINTGAFLGAEGAAGHVKVTVLTYDFLLGQNFCRKKLCKMIQFVP